jgi:Rad3-related DNA helicase
MRDMGLRLKSVTLTAADKICFNGLRNCNPDMCGYADGHYDRVNEALYDLLTHEDSFTREVVEKYARKHRLCPYEFSLDLALWSECIIADYNYVFDPRTYLRRFFRDIKGDYVFLIDEAHNLVDRAREMYSAQLTKKAFLTIGRQLDAYLGKKQSKNEKIKLILTDINREMINIRKECGNRSFVSHELPDGLIGMIRSFVNECQEFMRRFPALPFADELLTLFFESLTYVKTADFYDSRYVSITELDGSDVIQRLFCIDPSRLLNERVKSGRAAIFFSATLTPLDYFISLLGGDENSDK